MKLFKVYNNKCMLPDSKSENKFQQSPPFLEGEGWVIKKIFIF